MRRSYGAFKHILNECLDNATGPGLVGYNLNVSWKWGNEWYWIRRLYPFELCFIVTLSLADIFCRYPYISVRALILESWVIPRAVR